MNPTLTDYQKAVQNGPAMGAGSASDYAAKANGLTTATSTNPSVGTVPTTGAPTPITVDTLGTGAKPVTIPPATSTPTTTPTVVAPAGTVTDANGQATVPPPQKTDTQPQEQNWYQKQLRSIYEKLTTKGDVTAQLQTDTQLEDKRNNATAKYNEYMKASKDLTDKVQAIYTKSGGTTAGAEQEVAALKQTEGSRIANLAIDAQIAQGLATTAQQTINDKLDAQFKPLLEKAQFLKEFPELNPDNLTDKEKILFAQKSKQMEEDATAVRKVNQDVHQAVLDNGNPAGVLSALDKVTEDYKAGKLTATQAQAQYYQTAGKYGGDMNKQLQQMKLRQDISNGDPVNGEDKAAALSGDVQDVLTGRNTIGNIRLQMGRTKDATAYLKDMRSEIRKVDPNFDFVASDAGSKFVSSTYYQKALGSINAVLPNIDTITKLSNDVSRIGIKGVDALLQKGEIQLGDKKVANFHQAQKLIADEIGVALGAGSVSDMKLQLGFDVTDPSVTPEVFASNMQLVKSFLENRVKGLNEQRYKSSTVGGETTGGNTSVLTGPDGKQYNVPNDQVDAFIKAGGKK